MSEAKDRLERKVAAVLARAYGLTQTSVVRVPAGRATDNFVVKDEGDQQWFAKMYRDHSTLAQEQDAIDLAMFARAGGAPVPRIRRTKVGGCIGDVEGVALSLWEYVIDAETAEGGLAGDRWANVGLVLGRLHRHLAEHPACCPTGQPAAELRDLEHDRCRFDRLIATYRHLGSLSEDQEWALNAALRRRSLLPRVHAILQGLPPLVVQVVHGDLSSINLLMRGDDVAGSSTSSHRQLATCTGRSHGSAATRRPFCLMTVGWQDCPNCSPLTSRSIP